MPCYSPQRVWYSKDVGANGKRGITFNRSLAFVDLPLVIPCQQCIGCRLERSSDWGVRCVHEDMFHESSEYITLTYDPAFLPEAGSLFYRDVQLFWKSLRKKFGRFRYFVGGEYGEDFGRPHYHAIVFGLYLPDKVFYKKNKRGENLYTSELLASVWKRGFCTVGEVTFDSASYVAKYCVEKVTGERAAEHYMMVDPDGRLVMRAPEFGRSSNQPGIGAAFVEKYADQLLRDGNVVVNGKELPFPRYYDKLLEKIDPVGLERLKLQRREVMKALQAGDEKFSSRDSLPRIVVRHAVAQAKLKRKDQL